MAPVMAKAVEVLLYFKRKLLRRKRQSIGGVPPAPPRPAASSRPQLSMDDTREEVVERAPLTPAQARSIKMLRVATPLQTDGILIHEGSESEGEDEGSQAEEADDEWMNQPVTDIVVDTPEEFVLIGGEESPASGLSEDVEETDEQSKEHTREAALFDYGQDEYFDDELEDINTMQKDFPVQAAKREEEYFFYPTTFVADEDGYEWEEPLGFSDPALAPPLERVPAHLHYPALVHKTEEEIKDVAEAVIEADAAALAREKKRVTSPRKRPDTPISDEETTSWAAHFSASISPSSRSAASFKPARPECAVDEDNAWLRSLYEKAGLEHEIPDWMKIDPAPTMKTMPLSESPSVAGMREEREWASASTGGQLFSPAFSFSPMSVSTIVPINDSARSTLSSASDTHSYLGKSVPLEVSVKARVALARPNADYYQTTFGCGVSDDEEK